MRVRSHVYTRFIASSLTGSILSCCLIAGVSMTSSQRLRTAFRSVSRPRDREWEAYQLKANSTTVGRNYPIPAAPVRIIKAERRNSWTILFLARSSCRRLGKQGIDQSLALRERLAASQRTVDPGRTNERCRLPSRCTFPTLSWRPTTSLTTDMLLAARQIRGAQIVLANVFQAKDLKFQVNRGSNFANWRNAILSMKKPRPMAGNSTFRKRASSIRRSNVSCSP